MSYASLVHAGNVADPEIGRFYQTMQERVNAISTELLFFTLELNRIDDDALAAKEADPALAHYRPVAARHRAPFARISLSDELEKLLHEKSVAGRAAWTRLFDETIADLRFPFRGHELDRGRGAAPPVRPRRRGAPRGGAQRSARCSAGTRALFALITNTLAKDKEIEDRWRRFRAADLVAQSVEFRRGRGGRRADRRGARQLPAPVAPLLPAEGALVRGRGTAVLGPQRAAARG